MLNEKFPEDRKLCQDIPTAFIFLGKKGILPLIGYPLNPNECALATIRDALVVPLPF